MKIKNYLYILGISSNFALGLEGMPSQPPLREEKLHCSKLEL